MTQQPADLEQQTWSSNELVFLIVTKGGDDVLAGPKGIGKMLRKGQGVEPELLFPVQWQMKTLSASEWRGV